MLLGASAIDVDQYDATWLRRSRWPTRALTLARLLVKFRIMAKDAFLVKRQAALRGKIPGNPLAGRHSCAQRHDVPVPSRISCHRVRKRVAQSGNDLEQRQISVGEAAADQVGGAMWIICKHALEIADVF